MTTGSRFSMPRLFAAALCVAILGTTAPASAADLGVHPSWHARHIRVSEAYWNWRDRCASSGSSSAMRNERAWSTSAW